MTIAIAWTRTISGCEELIFVTDSRLSGDGRTFDACPKTMTLPRDDCAIAFAGFTGHAYPMMQQLSFAIDAHAPLKRGSLELPQVKSHALKIFDAMSAQIRSSDRLSSPVETNPEAEFLFGGYSWIKKRFELWHLHYSAGDKRYKAEPAQWLCYLADINKTVIRKSKQPADKRLGLITFAGDQAGLARRKLLEKLNCGAPSQGTLDWEPFEVVRDMLRDQGHSETIGGPPQIVKVYQYMKSASLAVTWPNASTGQPHLQGRALLGYERTEKFVLDPDTLMTAAHRMREQP
ncbi:hypothetical protein ELH50_30250 (plasmid) [Rhizobium ruizarguesonis]|uniref:hypothetical protein n=1 Tax=Rhizobium ruizarguesonis TaxID=2081791 RepID=UPI0010312013|nr:hypothetical protein [Rhizobium ruizarguesonis]TAT74822.1 hypothetical protein ELI52_28895 [Rhizobium ruizarguesonis]TBA99065.1 hypothetical protein ELH50_30250 [Rhizobium ruizarguesonis]